MTYFEGDPQNGLEPDNEARQYWLEQGVADDHILTGSAKDNFWGKSTILPSLTRLNATSKRWVLLGLAVHAGVLRISSFFVHSSFVAQRNAF